ncbi:hypothetical protein RYX36_023667 [Vicia faba]
MHNPFTKHQPISNSDHENLSLKRWCWWSCRHPDVDWDTFTTYFLWRFKPEYRDILPVFDKEEELDAEVSPLMEINGIYEEKMNEILQDWEEFLLSTEHIEVPVVQTNLTKTTTVPLANAFNDNIVDLIEATMTIPITIVESFKDNKIVS